MYFVCNWAGRQNSVRMHVKRKATGRNQFYLSVVLFSLLLYLAEPTGQKGLVTFDVYLCSSTSRNTHQPWWYVPARNPAGNGASLQTHNRGWPTYHSAVYRRQTYPSGLCLATSTPLRKALETLWNGGSDIGIDFRVHLPCYFGLRYSRRL